MLRCFPVRVDGCGHLLQNGSLLVFMVWDELCCVSPYGLSKALGLLRGHRVAIIIALSLKPCAVCHFVQTPLRDLGCLHPLGHWVNMPFSGCNCPSWAVCWGHFCAAVCLEVSRGMEALHPGGTRADARGLGPVQSVPQAAPSPPPPPFLH